MSKAGTIKLDGTNQHAALANGDIIKFTPNSTNTTLNVDILHQSQDDLIIKGQQAGQHVGHIQGVGDPHLNDRIVRTTEYKVNPAAMFKIDGISSFKYLSKQPGQSFQQAYLPTIAEIASLQETALVTSGNVKINQQAVVLARKSIEKKFRKVIDVFQTLINNKTDAAMFVLLRTKLRPLAETSTGSCILL